MNKRLILWLVTAALIIISLPGLFMRWDAESANKTYEVAMPLHTLSAIANDEEDVLDEGLRDLKDAGLTAVSLTPMSLSDLNKRDIISLFSQNELERMLHFADVDDDFKQETYGFYLTIPEDDYYIDVITSNFDPVTITVNDQDLFFIEEEKGDNRASEDIGYDEKLIEFIKSYDLDYILRAKNNDEDINEHMIDHLISFKDDPRLSNILFSGTEIIGHLNLKTPIIKEGTDKVHDYAEALDEAGFGFYSIEFSDQKGMRELAQTTNYNVIRLFSLNLNRDSFDDNVNRIIRAVKERNIRSAYIHPLTGDDDGLKYTIEFVQEVNDKMPNHFKLGTPSAFKQYSPPLWSVISVLLAGISFTYLTVNYLRLPMLSYGSAILMGILAIAYLILNKTILLQGFGLIIAILTPTYAIISTLRNPSTKLSDVTIKYLRALAITTIGLLILLGTLNGPGFISGFETFRGVKLLYVLPIILVTLGMFLTKDMQHLNNPKDLINTDQIKASLKQPIRYAHLIILVIIAGIGFYYITRTGNAGSVSDIEVLLRNKLEEIFYVRPRTKEFLIGLPIYILGLYVMGISKQWGKIILIPGSIGLLSIMNTFTHFHIPLDISILRTVYGIILGYIVGLVYIYLFKLLYRSIPKSIKER